MGRRKLAVRLGAALLGAAGLVFSAYAVSQAENLELVRSVVVPGNAGWVDTGLDVGQGEEFTIRGTGEITLQKGNPSANCGPAGLDLMTVQQPITGTPGSLWKCGMTCSAMGFLVLSRPCVGGRTIAGGTAHA